MPVLRADKTAIVMIDHVVGFMTSFRTHEVDAHVNAAVGLAKTAKIYDVPLLVTGGEDTDPSGPQFPALTAVLGDTGVIVRRGNFNAFDTPGFVEALQATGRRTLLMSGLMTEGCVAQTAMAAARGFDVYVVVDAVAGLSREAHDAALRRMYADGIKPITWFAASSEFQRTYDNVATVRHFMDLMVDHVPALSAQLQFVRSTSRG